MRGGVRLSDFRSTGRGRWSRVWNNRGEARRLRRMNNGAGGSEGQCIGLTEPMSPTIFGIWKDCNVIDGIWQECHPTLAISSNNQLCSFPADG